MLYDNSYGLTRLWTRLEREHHEDAPAMARRFDAFGQLLATFRLIPAGCEHPDLALIGYGGHMFDPERFPALEGRRVRIADLDGDGQREILAGVGNMKLHALEASGEQRWEFVTHYGVFRSFAVADYDGDGRPEIIGGTDGLSCTSDCRVIDSDGEQMALLPNDGWVSSLSALLLIEPPASAEAGGRAVPSPGTPPNFRAAEPQSFAGQDCQTGSGRPRKRTAVPRPKPVAGPPGTARWSPPAPPASPAARPAPRSCASCSLRSPGAGRATADHGALRRGPDAVRARRGLSSGSRA